jgi:hypothetical protein
MATTTGPNRPRESKDESLLATKDVKCGTARSETNNGTETLESGTARSETNNGTEITSIGDDWLPDDATLQHFHDSGQLDFDPNQLRQLVHQILEAVAAKGGTNKLITNNYKQYQMMHCLLLDLMFLATNVSFDTWY